MGYEAKGQFIAGDWQASKGAASFDDFNPATGEVWSSVPDAGRDDAKGIDQELRQIKAVEKVHVDFDNGMVMVWMKQGETLDEVLAEKIVKGAEFILNDFERPK